VARACRQGGISSAKATMKDLVKAGRGAGLKFTCDTCHTDQNDHSRLAPGARDKLAQLIDAVSRK
jgi:hypothetical protein